MVLLCFQCFAAFQKKYFSSDVIGIYEFYGHSGGFVAVLPGSKGILLGSLLWIWSLIRIKWVVRMTLVQVLSWYSPEEHQKQVTQNPPQCTKQKATTQIRKQPNKPFSKKKWVWVKAPTVPQCTSQRAFEKDDLKMLYNHPETGTCLVNSTKHLARPP